MVSDEKNQIHSVEFWRDLAQEVGCIVDPQTVLFELFKRFKGRAAIISSGQLTGLVLIQMAFENQLPFRVCTIDTGRLFQETYDFLEQVEHHYGIQIERVSAQRASVDQMVRQHGEYLFFDSQAKQEYCCKIRKVNPQRELLDNLDKIKNICLCNDHIWINNLNKAIILNLEEEMLVVAISLDNHI